MRCSKLAGLFDHLVGAGENGFRNREPDLLGSFQVDDKDEFIDLFDWQITRVGRG
jgi:hypothetical protein